jgi:hypothetical protein
MKSCDSHSYTSTGSGSKPQPNSMRDMVTNLCRNSCEQVELQDEVGSKFRETAGILIICLQLITLLEQPGFEGDHTGKIRL